MLAELLDVSYFDGVCNIKNHILDQMYYHLFNQTTSLYNLIY